MKKPLFTLEKVLFFDNLSTKCSVTHAQILQHGALKMFNN